MPTIHIESVADPRLAVYRDLKSPESKRRSDRFVVEGRLLAERLLQSELRIASVVAEDRLVEELRSLVPQAVPLYVLPRGLFKELAGFKFHRGVLACGYRPDHPDLRTAVDAAGRHCVLSVCVGVGDPENLGGIIRTSAAFGVAAVVLGPNCVDPFSRRVARTAMGTNFRLPVAESSELEQELSVLRGEAGVRLVATVIDNTAVPLDAMQWSPRTAVLFGSEGFGLDQHWLALCDDRVTIPMRPGVDSLNVSVAAGIFLFHATRRLRHVANPREDAEGNASS